MGCESLIEKSKELRAYVPTAKLEEMDSVRGAIEEYNSENVWEELIERLVERDMTAKISTMTKEPSSPEEYMEIAGPIEERYATEFSMNGIRRLKLGET